MLYFAILSPHGCKIHFKKLLITLKNVTPPAHQETSLYPNEIFPHQSANYKKNSKTEIFL